VLLLVLLEFESNQTELNWIDLTWIELNDSVALLSNLFYLYPISMICEGRTETNNKTILRISKMFNDMSTICLTFTHWSILFYLVSLTTTTTAVLILGPVDESTFSQYFPSFLLPYSFLKKSGRSCVSDLVLFDCTEEWPRRVRDWIRWVWVSSLPPT